MWTTIIAALFSFLPTLLSVCIPKPDPTPAEAMKLLRSHYSKKHGWSRAAIRETLPKARRIAREQLASGEIDRMPKVRELRQICSDTLDEALAADETKVAAAMAASATE